MRTKLEYLREQVAAYLRDAAAARDEREGHRLFMLAAKCHEQVLHLERPADGQTSGLKPFTPRGALQSELIWIKWTPPEPEA